MYTIFNIFSVVFKLRRGTASSSRLRCLEIEPLVSHPDLLALVLNRAESESALCRGLICRFVVPDRLISKLSRTPFNPQLNQTHQTIPFTEENIPGRTYRFFFKLCDSMLFTSGPVTVAILRVRLRTASARFRPLGASLTYKFPFHAQNLPSLPLHLSVVFQSGSTGLRGPPLCSRPRLTPDHSAVGSPVGG